MSRRVPLVARVLQEGGLYVLLLLLPFSKAAVEIAFSVMLCGWLLERLHPATRAETIWCRASLRPLVLALGLFAAACALSIFWSDRPQASLRALFSKWGEYLLLAVITADVARRPEVPRRCLAVLACSAVFVIVEGVWQEWFSMGLLRRYRLDFFSRMTGPYENPIDLATYLMVMIWVLAGYAAGRRGAVRWGLGLLVLALVACLARTQSLGSWLGLGVGFAVVGSRSAVARRWGLLLVAVAILGGGFALWRSGNLHRLYSRSDIGRQDRLWMWQAGLGMVRDRPLLGHGLNRFMAHYLEYWVGGQYLPRYAHNCYLQMAAETGLIGLAAFLALLWSFFARVWSGLRRVGPADALLLLGLLGGLAAFAAQASIDTNFYSLRQAALFWTLAGLAVGLTGTAESAACGPS